MTCQAEPTYTTPRDALHIALGLPGAPKPRSQRKHDLVVSKLTGAIHRLTDIGPVQLTTACGMRLPLDAVEPYDGLIHYEADDCDECLAVAS